MTRSNAFGGKTLQTQNYLPSYRRLGSQMVELGAERTQKAWNFARVHSSMTFSFLLLHSLLPLSQCSHDIRILQDIEEIAIGLRHTMETVPFVFAVSTEWYSLDVTSFREFVMFIRPRT